jgi:hypothetical protein
MKHSYGGSAIPRVLVSVDGVSREESAQLPERSDAVHSTITPSICRYRKEAAFCPVVELVFDWNLLDVVDHKDVH